MNDPNDDNGSTPQPPPTEQPVTMVPHVCSFKAPQGFVPVKGAYCITWMAEDGRFFVNAPFNNPVLVLSLLRETVNGVTGRIGGMIQQAQGEQSRIFAPGSFRAKRNDG